MDPPDDNSVQVDTTDEFSIIVPGGTVTFPPPTDLAIKVDPEEFALKVDGNLLISGISDDVKTTILNMQKRLDKLERFYTRIVVEAQEVVNVAEQTESNDQWKERVFQIAKDLGI